MDYNPEIFKVAVKILNRRINKKLLFSDNTDF